jgi:hypothetical protein
MDENNFGQEYNEFVFELYDAVKNKVIKDIMQMELMCSKLTIFFDLDETSRRKVNLAREHLLAMYPTVILDIKVESRNTLIIKLPDHTMASSVIHWIKRQVDEQK